MPRFLALAAKLRQGLMMNRRAIVFAVLTAALLCFIWGQSLAPIGASDAESRGVLRWLQPLIDPQGRIDEESFHHFVRKAAHFSEFAALGFCMCGWFLNLQWKKPNHRVPAALGACVLAACMDEGIQCFNPGRGPKLTDVLLDSCGALFGIAVVLTLLFIINKCRKTAV